MLDSTLLLQRLGPPRTSPFSVFHIRLTRQTPRDFLLFGRLNESLGEKDFRSVDWGKVCGAWVVLHATNTMLFHRNPTILYVFCAACNGDYTETWHSCVYFLRIYSRTQYLKFSSDANWYLQFHICIIQQITKTKYLISKTLMEMDTSPQQMKICLSN